MAHRRHRSGQLARQMDVCDQSQQDPRFESDEDMNNGWGLGRRQDDSNDTSWDALIEAEISEELNIVHHCVLCNRQRATVVNLECQHCVLCVECAISIANTLRQQVGPPLQAFHLYQQDAFVQISCPICSSLGRAKMIWLVRDWYLGDEGGLAGDFCCSCQLAEADVVLTCCFRLAYCAPCAAAMGPERTAVEDFHSLSGAPVIQCPACGNDDPDCGSATMAPALRMFWQ